MTVKVKAAERSLSLDAVLARLDALLARAEILLDAPVATAPDWRAAIAWRWRRGRQGGTLQSVRRPHAIRLTDLHGIDPQKALVERNTRQFVAGFPANNVLLTGARGTGKSSLVKALLNEYAHRKLRVIEIGKQDLGDLPELVDLVCDRPERFILYCDDLSFSAEEPGYQALKAVLDGSLAATSDNVVVYATSNRRHLMPEYMQENLEAHRVGDEIHPGESVEEKISLSERFGLWVSFHPFRQDDYLDIVRYWVEWHGAAVQDADRLEREALQWALGRGSRSGRVAFQFARDWAGRHRAKRTAQASPGRVD
ncbi:MAG TPA: ATP-binding protein [Burkholderiales bacterium]|nr:ATP-binding protein [Burkholderiales bacterium]